MNNEFRVQVRVGTVMIANIVMGLKKRGEIGAFRSANALVQSALRIAEDVLVMEMSEDEEVRSIEDAVEILESTQLFNFNVQSNQESMFRGRRKEAIEESRNDRNRAKTYTGKTNAAGESEFDAIVRIERDRLMREREKKLSPEEFRRMHEESPSESSVYPRDRGEEVDMVIGEE